MTKKKLKKLMFGEPIKATGSEPMIFGNMEEAPSIDPDQLKKYFEELRPKVPKGRHFKVFISGTPEQVENWEKVFRKRLLEEVSKPSLPPYIEVQNIYLKQRNND